MDEETRQIALIGNPNSGKSSVFNYLTGLRQKVGNFPGVTVEKKEGLCSLPDGSTVKITDFPGTYSLYPTAKDEQIVVQTFTDLQNENFPDAVLFVADITNLERHILLLTQINDLGIPVALALSMADIAQKKGINIDVQQIEELFQIPTVAISSRTGENLPQLKQVIQDLTKTPNRTTTLKTFYNPSGDEKKVLEPIQQHFNLPQTYHALLYAHHFKWLPHLTEKEKAFIEEIVENEKFESLRFQVRETMARYDRFLPNLQKAIQSETAVSSITDKIDYLATHKIFGPAIFVVLMILIFQAIFALADIPMGWIDSGFGFLQEQIQQVLPESWFTSLLTDGILAGLGGILIFIPQIAILFFLIAILEELGYMARAVFIFDKLMQRFGLNGRSIVALVSGGACAIPAVMSTRTISNWKERLITILVTPFISCSARIPVYVIMIGLVVPATSIWGIFNLQGIVFMGLYVLGILAALGAAYVFKLILKTSESSFLIIELPPYRTPQLRNVLLTVKEKVGTFVVEAGKIIFFISILLWFAANFGPPGAMEKAEQTAIERAQIQNLSESQAENLIASKKLEASFAGHLGKGIEPAIEPLGYDWKIGIALITSFAAREVFVGTMATLYSIGNTEDERGIQEQMAKEIDPDTGKPVYTLATAFSILVFYVFAMQCMSTLAVVQKETNSWKWPIIQFLFMTGLAYVASLVVYQVMA